MRIPQREARSAYAGPIPRRVVPDALPRALLGAEVVLPGILDLVDREQGVGPVGDDDLAAQEPATLELADLFLERKRFDDHPGSAHPDDAVAEDPAGELVEHDQPSGRWIEWPAFGPAAGPHHVACIGGQEVGDLALAPRRRTAPRPRPERSSRSPSRARGAARVKGPLPAPRLTLRRPRCVAHGAQR